eukprot:293397-Prymnesium_polylepis.1
MCIRDRLWIAWRVPTCAWMPCRPEKGRRGVVLCGASQWESRDQKLSGQLMRAQVASSGEGRGRMSGKEASRLKAIRHWLGTEGFHECCGRTRLHGLRTSSSSSSGAGGHV